MQNEYEQDPDDLWTDPDKDPNADPDAIVEEETTDEDEGRRHLDPYDLLSEDSDAQQEGEGGDGTGGKAARRGLSVDERLERANEQMANGQVNEALHHYREAVRSAGASAEGTDHRVTLGDAYAYSGQALNAFRQYRRAIKTSPRKAEPHF